MHVDLGCGAAFKGDVNIDINYYPNIPGMKVCNLGFQRIPLDDGVADIVSIHCAIEHIPFYIYLNKEGEKYSPMRQLFCEVTRILKSGGTFFIKVPQSPSHVMWMDPTHMSVWTKLTAPYLVGPQAWDVKIMGNLHPNGKGMGILKLTQNKEISSAMLEIIFTKE